MHYITSYVQLELDVLASIFLTYGSLMVYFPAFNENGLYFKHTNRFKQAQLGVPHSEIQVELD